MVLVCAALGGCQPSQPSVDDASTVVGPAPATRPDPDDDCAIVSLQVQHNQFYPFVNLKPGVDPGEFVGKLLAFLQLPDPPEVSEAEGMRPALSPRHFWALILADHTQGSLELFRFESQAVRAAKVAALLARYRVSAEASSATVTWLSAALRQQILSGRLDLTAAVREHGARTALEALLGLLHDPSQLSSRTVIKLEQTESDGMFGNVLSVGLTGATLVATGQLALTPPVEDAAAALRTALEARPLVAKARSAAVERWLSSGLPADLWAALLTIDRVQVRLDPERCVGPGVLREGRLLEFSGLSGISVSCEEGGAVFARKRIIRR